MIFYSLPIASNQKIRHLFYRNKTTGCCNEPIKGRILRKKSEGVYDNTHDGVTGNSEENT